jgi:hypothetical protein
MASLSVRSGSGDDAHIRQMGRALLLAIYGAAPSA